MAGTGVAITSGDAIPLLDDNGSGQYIKGRNNALDIRKGLIGSVFLPGADGVTPRPGVLMGVGGTGAFKVNAQGSPNQTVLVGKGAAIVPRTGQGAYLLYMDVDQTVNMPAASGANTRWDIVCLASFDLGNFVGDGAHGPQIWIESGTLGGGVPATPTGMIKLADVFRAVNDNVISSEITDMRKSTVVSGVTRQLGPGDLVGDAGLIVGEMRDVNGAVDRWNGTIWYPIYSTTGPRGVIAETKITGATDSVLNTETMLETLTVNVKAGRRYRINWHGMLSTTTAASPMPTIRIRTAVGASVTIAGTIVRETGASAQNATNYSLTLIGSFLATVDEQRTFGFSIISGGGAQTASLIRGTTARLFQVEDTGV